MIEIICIVGLPGSGKTHYATMLKQQFGGILVDDVKDQDQLPRDATTLYITDVNFCRPVVRSIAQKVLAGRYPGAVITWVFFENNPEKCRNNVRHRNDGREVDRAISLYSNLYTIPPDAVPLEIWQQTE